MSIRVFVGVWLLLLFLASCSQTPPTSVIVKPKVTTKPQEVVKDSHYYIEQAKLAFSQNKDINQRNAQLLIAAEKLQQEASIEASIGLLNTLIPRIAVRSQLSQAYLMLAENYQALNDEHLVKHLNTILPKISTQDVDPSRLAWLAYLLQAKQENWLSAAQQLLKTDLDNREKANRIWQAISNLDSKKLERARSNEEQLLPYIQLAIITQKYALSAAEFSQQLSNWQQQNQGHPLQQQLPKSLVDAQQTDSIHATNIAVLLPLTGRLASQGKLLKEGILTAYLEDSSKQVTNNGLRSNQPAAKNTIRFFDSANKNSEQLNALLTDYNVIIGPLSKDKIQGLTQLLAADKILLALNRIDESPALGGQQRSAIENDAYEHFYFSLAPEDEAKQLAQHIYNLELQQPIIFADDNTITKRMATAFSQQWQQLTRHSAPRLTVFQSNKDMRKSVAEMLDVEQSKNRIKLIERLADVDVISHERNRRDIDSVVLFANPQQTSLLNPIIEASLSSFAEVSLQVFATSRSYRQNQTISSLRDLRHLTFSDMPWLLPEHDWPALASRVEELWPQRKDSSARLFAMGYDAYSFIPQLRHLKMLPQITSQGLTGQISVGPNGTIRRQLPWAKVEKNKVTVLGMD
jgi:outer membrane PBP1 activator LpoA protein